MAPRRRDEGEVFRRRLNATEVLVVYRLVHVADRENPRLVEDFESNAARGRVARGRELRDPEIHHGISVFKTLDQALERRDRIVQRLRARDQSGPLQIGDFVAEVQLSGADFSVEDLGQPDGHMTIWGEPFKLAGRVADIYPAPR